MLTTVLRLLSMILLLLCSACASRLPSVHAHADFTPAQSPIHSGEFITLVLVITNTTHSTIPATADSEASRPLLRVNGNLVTAEKNVRATELEVAQLAPGASVSTGVGGSPEFTEKLFGSEFSFQWEYQGARSEVVRVNCTTKQSWIEE